jgi:hypothetical protein
MRGLQRGIVPVGLGRLSADREFVAMQACGVSIFRMLRPIALLSATAAAATAYVIDGRPSGCAFRPSVRRPTVRQPFTRNYGLRPVAHLSGPPTRMSSAEAEALIACAIAEHEMRRP